jgi:hypothetical protein
VALTQAQAMTGLGGIGKTQIAVEYAYRTHEQGVYTHTLWINAGSEEAILTSFTALAALLPAFAAANETNQQKLVNAIKAWLEGWLSFNLIRGSYTTLVKKAHQQSSLKTSIRSSSHFWRIPS